MIHLDMRNELRLLFFWSSGVLLAILCTFYSYTTTGTETLAIPFTTDTVKDDGLELGDSLVRVYGIDGERTVANKTTGTLLQRLIFPGTVDKDELKSTIILEPTKKVVAVGTKKYQYMYCSDNHYLSYSDVQFNDPEVGFTSKSEDDCRNKGYGSKVKLADTPPPAKPRCIDVTSYDYNWNNDMLCYNADGSSYYTSYAGARR